MLYLGIDLHLKQMTVSLRNEGGDVVLRRQVSTRWKKVDEFLEQVHQEGADGGDSYVAILEVCGFHDWLVKRLEADGRCQDVMVVQSPPLGWSSLRGCVFVWVFEPDEQHLLRRAVFEV